MFILRWSVAVLFCVGISVVAPAQEVTDLIPDDALGYAVVRNLDVVDQKVQGIAERLHLPLPSLVGMVTAPLGGDAGLNTSGTVALAVFPGDEGPAMILLAPVSDYAAFLERVEVEQTTDGLTTGTVAGRPLVIGNRTPYAVIGGPQDRSLVARLVKADANDAGDARAKRSAELTAEYDVAARINPSGIETLAELGRQGLSETKKVIVQQLGEDNPSVAGIEMYVQLLDMLKNEVDHTELRIRVNDGGAIQTEQWVGLQNAGDWATQLREVTPGQGELLTGLPDVPYVFAFAASIPESVMPAMMDFSTKIMKAAPQLYQMSPDEVDQMAALSREYFSDMQGMSFVLGVGQGEAPIYNEMLATIQVEDAPAFVERYREYFDRLDEILGEDSKSFMKSTEVEQLEIDGRSALKLKMGIPGIEGLDQAGQPQVEEMIKKMYGEDGFTAYLTALDDHTVAIAYVEPTLLGATRQAVIGGGEQLANSQSIRSTTALLPEGAQAVGYWSPSGTVAFARRFVQVIPNIPQEISIPEFPQTPDIGWAAQMYPEGVKFTTIVPDETLRGLGEFIQTVRQDRQ